MYVLNNKTCNKMQKLIELQKEIDEFTIVVGDINTLFSEVDSFSRQKISKDIVKLNNTISQLDTIGSLDIFIQPQQTTHSS